VRQICSECEKFFDEELHSTRCPHQGIGFCRRCDCVVCVCKVGKVEDDIKIPLLGTVS
jgi:hypothetical protein